MDTIGRIRLRHLTRAVYNGADEDEPPPRRDLWRLLPSLRVAVVLLVAIVVLAGVGMWKTAGAAKSAHQHSETAEAEANQVPELPAPGHERQSTPDRAGQSTASTPETVVVYVSGEVAAPGIVTLPANARLHEAIAGVGGMTEAADSSSVNLARIVTDGEHIVVLARGQTSVPGEGANAVAGAPSATTGGGGESTAGGAAACIDLNTASADELQKLDGIGPALAGRIVDYRNANGPFDSLAAVDAVSGIGSALLQRIGAGSCQQ